MAITLTAAKEAIANVDVNRAADYEAYFETLAPKTLDDVFRRWMFAYASVHTTWENNCKLYEQLKPLDWIGNDQLLFERVTASKAGMQNMRTKFISQFTEFFWRHPTWFNKSPTETWFEYRDRIMKRAPGIGLAKAAFFIELTCFHKSKVACFDTHMVQLYGFTPKEYAAGKVRGKDFTRMEQHWTNTCLRRKLSPVTARWLVWDAKKQQQNSRYWTYVLET